VILLARLSPMLEKYSLNLVAISVALEYWVLSMIRGVMGKFEEVGAFPMI